MDRTFIHSRVFKLGCLLLALWAVANIGYGLHLVQSTRENGLVDFNQYWYAGLYLRAGVNPYEAFVKNIGLAIPRAMLGGTANAPETIISYPLALRTLPGNTAPLMLILSGFSFLPLQQAVYLWTAVNIGLTLAIPALMLKLLGQKGLSLPKGLGAMAVLVFVGLNSTRGCIANGQPSLAVWALMLLALVEANEGKSALAGGILGVALSKYSLALPILVVFLVKRRWKAVAIAIAVQLLAIGPVSIRTRTSMFSTVDYYASIAMAHATQQMGRGIDLSAYLPAGPAFATLAFVSTTGLIAVACIHTLRRAKSLGTEGGLLDASLISVLLLWTLLAGYHRGYDAIVTIMPMAFCAGILHVMDTSDARRAGMRVSAVLLSAALVVLMTPGSVFRYILGFYKASDMAVTAAVAILLCANVVIFLKLGASQRMTTAQGAAGNAVKS